MRTAHCCSGVVVGVKGKGAGRDRVRIEVMREGRCGVMCGSRTSSDSIYGMGQVIEVKERERAFVFGCRPEAAATRWLEVIPRPGTSCQERLSETRVSPQEEVMTRKVQLKRGQVGWL